MKRNEKIRNTRQKSFNLMNEIISFQKEQEKRFYWNEILTAITNITRTKSDQAEKILSNLLEYDRPIPLDQKSEIPHSMSPENMLKSLAIQTLAKWTGKKYIKQFQTVYSRTESPILKEIITMQEKKLNIE